MVAVKSVEDISEYLKTVTRLLAESKYANTETEFTCVTKYVTTLLICAMVSML